MHREFLLQRFLARVFSDPGSPWVLKGGGGLLVRLPRARYSDDVDLLYPAEDVELSQPVAELREVLARPYEGDFLRFEVVQVQERLAEGAEKALAAVRMEALLGATVYGRFPIDLSVKKRPVAAVERLKPRPVVVVPGVPELPEFSLYPLS